MHCNVLNLDAGMGLVCFLELLFVLSTFLMIQNNRSILD